MLLLVICCCGTGLLSCRFMDLSRASSALSTKRGAAVGVARIARLAAAAAAGQQVCHLTMSLCQLMSPLSKDETVMAVLL